jgi:hypothetical protein
MGVSPSLSPVSHKNRQSWLIIGFLAVIYGPVIFHWYDGWLNKSIGIEHEYFSLVMSIISTLFAFSPIVPLSANNYKNN